MCVFIISICVCMCVWFSRTTPWNSADLEARERTAQAWIEAVTGRPCVAYQTKQFARNIMRWVCGGCRYRGGPTTVLLCTARRRNTPKAGRLRPRKLKLGIDRAHRAISANTFTFCGGNRGYEREANGEEERRRGGAQHALKT